MIRKRLNVSLRIKLDIALRMLGFDPADVGPPLKLGQPWVELGLSKATYYRRLARQDKNPETN
jgi:hypothetical protein